MKNELRHLIQQAAETLAAADEIQLPGDLEPAIERTRDARHGDFACNLALVLAKRAGMRPRTLAEKLVGALPSSPLVKAVEIAGPGFINFHLATGAYHAFVPRAIEEGHEFGRNRSGAGRRVQVEFVSANPTGPLHVGHGRGAAYGAVVADLLTAVGFDVHREYYVNDAGRQMDILAASVWLRYLELCDQTIPFPANGYRGDYVWDIAATLHREHQENYVHSTDEIFSDLPADEPDGGDKERYIDALIERTRELLGGNRYRFVFELALNVILDDIRNDLELFGVTYDEWYSERSLTETGRVNKTLESLRDRDYLYDKEGALWFRSTDFGDEKDRVVMRDNGQHTYFASDIAYHLDKLERGFDQVIDVWGADHHGYIPRVKAALSALGEDLGRLDVLLVQFANLYRGGQKVQMSTRSGSFITLRELRKEVGRDAARFFYVMRKCEQHLDFDLDLAKSKTNENPVYYIQYAHARVCSVLAQAAERNMTVEPSEGVVNLDLLAESQEYALMKRLSSYPEAVETAAMQREPHQLCHYLRELANDFHTYYNAYQFLVEDERLRDARIKLILAVRQVLRNGLNLLGVSAPERM